MTLHTLNKPTNHLDLIEQLNSSAKDSDTLILIEDGAYHCMETSSVTTWLKAFQTVCVLTEDLKARGISLPDNVKAISYQEFVKLSIDHETIISWY